MIGCEKDNLRGKVFVFFPSLALWSYLGPVEIIGVGIIIIVVVVAGHGIVVVSSTG